MVAWIRELVEAISTGCHNIFRDRNVSWRRKKATLL